MLNESNNGREAGESKVGKTWHKPEILQYLIDNNHPRIEQEYRKRVGARMQRGMGLVQRVKDIWNGIRRKVSPSVRKFTKENGTSNLVKITIGRQLIRSFIDTAASWLSLGLWDDNKKKLGYDKMLHLFMTIELAEGLKFKFERNHLPKISYDVSFNRCSY